jgi:octaprenyl-diphosphate synthase
MTPTPDSAPTLERLYAEVAPGLARVDSEITAALRAERPAIAEMIRHVGRYSGKKLRPVLVLLIGRAAGGITPGHHRLGAIVEMVHLATLIHDDVIDDADVRRRGATANARWSNYDAVLLGDILFSRAINLLAKLGDPRSLDVLTRAVSTLCEGEILQNRHRMDPGVSEALYYDIIREKTAVLYAAGCELAAHLAGAPPEAIKACATYGLELGLSFQIIDDCLDLFGDQAEVGKSLGTDVDGGKVTLPVILALATLPADQKLAWASRLSQGAADPALHADLRALVHGCGALDEALERARDHANRAKAATRNALDVRAVSDLDAIADFVVSRRR